MSAPREQLDVARWGLIRLWLIWGFLITASIVVQSILGHYGTQLRDAWSWFIPTIVPTTTLMLGVLGEAAMSDKDDTRTVRKDFYTITWWLSLGYLGLLTLTVALAPFAPDGMIELYTNSNYWLVPVQGLATAAIGVLFTSQQHAPQPPH